MSTETVSVGDLTAEEQSWDVSAEDAAELDAQTGSDETVDHGAPDATQGGSAIRIVKGNPTDHDLAALVTVLTAAASTASEPVDTRPPELWGAPTSMHRTYAPFSPYSFAASQRY